MSSSRRLQSSRPAFSRYPRQNSTCCRLSPASHTGALRPHQRNNCLLRQKRGLSSGSRPGRDRSGHRQVQASHSEENRLCNDKLCRASSRATDRTHRSCICSNRCLPQDCLCCSTGRFCPPVSRNHNRTCRRRCTRLHLSSLCSSGIYRGSDNNSSVHGSGRKAALP